TMAVSRGVPMLMAGDEFRRTQGGNNNAYCQDNETSWLDWSFADRNSEILRFARGAFAFRRAHAVLRREAFYTDQEVEWFRADGNRPDWSDANLRHVACMIQDGKEADICMLFNADFAPIDFKLPETPAGKQWRIAVDTSANSPDDVRDPGK